MRFQNKLSNKQIKNIFYIFLSILIIYFLKFELKNGIKLVLIITFTVLVSSIFSLFEEGNKRYKILRSKNTRDYHSGGERKIAEYFKAKKIKFYLHSKVKVPFKMWIFDNPFKKRILHPDFFLPQYGVFIEYWGMMDNEDYMKKRKLKEKAYKENNIEFISLLPKNIENRSRLDWDFTQKLLDLIREREGNNLKWKKF